MSEQSPNHISKFDKHHDTLRDIRLLSESILVELDQEEVGEYGTRSMYWDDHQSDCEVTFEVGRNELYYYVVLHSRENEEFVEGYSLDTKTFEAYTIDERGQPTHQLLDGEVSAADIVHEILLQAPIDSERFLQKKIDNEFQKITKHYVQTEPVIQNRIDKSIRYSGVHRERKLRKISAYITNKYGLDTSVANEIIREHTQ